MDTPPKTVTQIGTPVSKLKVENSPVFKYIESLSPIKTVKSIQIAQTFNSLSYASPPHAASHKGSRFRSHRNSSDPSKIGSVSNEEVDSTGEKVVVEEALLETEPPQILKNDCTITPRVINDGSFEDGQTDLQKMCDGNVKRQSDPDWETMISDSSELLIYTSPNDSEAYRCFLQRSSESKTRLCGATKPALVPVSGSNEPESSDALSNLHRGVRRRCLDFEMPGNNKQTSGKSSSRCVVPSIGLHLNAVAMSSKDNNVSNEYSFPGNVKVGLQSYTTPVLPSHDIVRENVTQEAAGQVVEEVPASLALVEMNQSSPKKKRRKSERAGESSCKRCNCKKSKCLKLYCECFAAGVYCIEPCSCVVCFNKPIHADTVLATRKQIQSRNPLAFAPKVIRNSDSIIEVGDDASKTPASARHKRGCNCKKSNCLKKYCECYLSKVACSINCRCEGCKNSFGRKDVSAGSSFAGIDIEQDDENKTSGKSGTAKPQHNAELFNSVLLPPSTPKPLRQPLAQLLISPNNRLLPQQSQYLHGASGSSLYNSQSFREQDMSLLSHPRIETITEDIENLIQSPINNINAVSPNSKRVSLPHLDSTESNPWRRSGGRKLLLSIPTFPPLSPHR